MMFKISLIMWAVANAFMLYDYEEFEEDVIDMTTVLKVNIFLFILLSFLV